jgi:hypothetical protein
MPNKDKNTEIQQCVQPVAMCCVDIIDGLTKNKLYKVVGYTNDKQMYVIDNDNGDYRCYGIDLFKHNT